MFYFGEFIEFTSMELSLRRSPKTSGNLTVGLSCFGNLCSSTPTLLPLGKKRDHLLGIGSLQNQKPKFMKPL